MPIDMNREVHVRPRGPARSVTAAGSHLLSWPIWAEPPAIRLLVFAVPASALTALSFAAVTTTWQVEHIQAFALLVAMATICMEMSRRLGEPTGVVKDMVSAWWLPLAFFLPPVYAMLAPVPLNAVTQLHVHRSPLHRRIFTTAAISLPHGAVSWAFHNAPWVSSVPGTGAKALLWGGTVLGGGALCALGNTLLVTLALRFTSMSQTWRGVGRDVLDKEKLGADTVEVCIGVAISVLFAASMWLTIVALPPVLMLQRSLMFSQLRSAARIDAKTGLLNAVTWEREAASEIARARRTDTPLTVMLLDLDLFKQINDVYGHLIGDRMLQAVARGLRAQLRDYDLVGRFGGEEFAILLPQTDAQQARLAAERLRRCVAAASVPLEDGATVSVTASIGVALFTRGTADVPDLLAAADAALYQAKRNGRNQVALSGYSFGAAEESAA
jgi:diguanylate cyclase (GGDEF)-like protein